MAHVPWKRRVSAARAGVVALALVAAACSVAHPRRDPTSEAFPRVEGRALDGSAVVLPDAFHGAPVLLLIGYEQEAQFDIDRWLLGLHQAGVRVPVFEIPTIPALAARPFARRIDAGMRSGIPAEDWSSVVTVYGDGDAVARFTGTTNGLTARVTLLDAGGRVVFFHDRGYSVGSLERLRAVLDAVDRSR